MPEKRTKKKKTPDVIDRAMPVSRIVDTVRSIRLEHCEASRVRRLEAAPNGADQARFDVEIQPAFGHTADGLNVLAYGITLRLLAFFKTVEQPITVIGRYHIEYGLKPGANKPSEANAIAFGQTAAMRMVWPFWREFVQSMTVRMGFPAVPVPVLSDGLFGDFSEPKEREHSQHT